MTDTMKPRTGAADLDATPGGARPSDYTEVGVARHGDGRPFLPDGTVIVWGGTRWRVVATVRPMEVRYSHHREAFLDTQNDTIDTLILEEYR